MIIYKNNTIYMCLKIFRTCGLPTVMVIWMCVTVEISGHDDAQRRSWRLKSNVTFETNPSEQPSWSATITDTLTNPHQYKLVIKVYSWLLSFTHVHKKTYTPRYLAKTRRISVYIYILFFSFGLLWLSSRLLQSDEFSYAESILRNPCHNDR